MKSEWYTRSIERKGITFMQQPVSRHSSHPDLTASGKDGALGRQSPLSIAEWRQLHAILHQYLPEADCMRLREILWRDEAAVRAGLSQAIDNPEAFLRQY